MTLGTKYDSQIKLWIYYPVWKKLQKNFIESDPWSLECQSRGVHHFTSLQVQLEFKSDDDDSIETSKTIWMKRLSEDLKLMLSGFD